MIFNKKEESKAERQYNQLSPEEKGEVFWYYMVRKCLQNKIVYDDKVKENIKEIVREVLKEKNDIQ